jgi:type IV pilus biogenesis protein CpaD/CtpE
MAPKALLKISVTAALAASLAACATSGNPGLARKLPLAPDYARPVLTADPKAGEDALIVAARERLGKAQANCIIQNFRNWYERVREAYARGDDGSALAKETAEKCGPLPRRGRP